MQRDFKGIWIPKELWILRDLSLLEKVMLIEIDSLDNENGCYASNDYFADFFGLSKDRISKVINNLVKRGFISSELKYKKGTCIVEKRVLKISRWYKATSKKNRTVGKNNDTPTGENNSRTLVENAEENKLENKLNSSSQIFEEPKIDDNDVKKKKIFEADSDPYLLAKFLEKCITENNPKFPQNESQRQRWAKDFDLMIRRDKIDADDIAEVIDWCQNDSFWRSNILSGKKVREKYQQLRMRIESR